MWFFSPTEAIIMRGIPLGSAPQYTMPWWTHPAVLQWGKKEGANDVWFLWARNL